MNKYQFDKFIKSEVESIDYNGGQEAWELFDAKRNKDTKPSTALVFTMWKPLAVAASVAVFCGILMHQSLVDEPAVFDNQTFATVEQPAAEIKNTKIESVISVKSNDDIDVIDSQVAEALIQSKATLSTPVNQEKTFRQQQTEIVRDQNILAEATFTTGDTKRSQGTRPSKVARPIENVQFVAADQSNELIVPQNKADQANPSLVLSNQLKIAESVLPLSSLAAIDASHLTGEFALDLSENLVKTKRRKMRLFAEFGIGNRQAGKQAIVGVSIPKDSWSLEAGLGLNHKVNNPLEYTDITESNIEDYDEIHKYTFTQKLNAIIPLKIRKRFGKRHAMLVGVQGSYNLSNQVDIQSSVPVRSSSLGGNASGGGFIEGEIDYFDINYQYLNANSVINSFALVSSNRWNLDLSAGYEFNFDRVALGVNVMKPVFSTFTVSEALSSPARFKITEQTRLNLSLKYYLG